ncbi:membrane protein [Lentzea sp. NBRC 105346]|uniref:bifunctional lysylphosphatidylglycerol flippase/synthetase MprF n=1 Tax=Lentzea sp. NBRC 105346 TaxID=3032205 RepID=UPI0024A2FB12|nr:DUF2156 domain-containing protein [Lentzea sp. NBRC 105346]GLZ29570.1 membrane protein [Lentzea sp. NBRC 105346]
MLTLWIVGAATGSLFDGPSEELMAGIGFGISSPLWTAVTSMLWCGNFAGYLGTTALLVLFGPVAERELGTARAIAFFLVSQVFGVFTGAGVARLGELIGWQWLSSMNFELAVMPSAGVVGMALATSFRLPELWRRRVRLLLIIALLVLALYSGYFEDVLRLCGGLVGLLAGALVVRTRTRPSPPSHEETRVLVALLIAASALGPVVAMLSPFPNGPLAWYSELVAMPQPDMDQIITFCADPTTQDQCRTMTAQAAYGRFPAMIMSVMPALLMLVLAEGVRRGRRFAWWGALALNIGLTGLTIWYVVEALQYVDHVTPGVLLEYSIPVLLYVAIAVVLLVLRKHFPLPTQVRRFWRLVVTGFMILSGLYIFGGFLARDQFTPEPGFLELVADLPSRFLPPGYLGLLPARFSADDMIAKLLFEYTGVFFWLIVFGGVLRASWRARPSCTESAAQQARELMVRHGGSSLSYMTTWDGNHYWFTPDGRAAVAYRVVATIALTVGDPVGEPDARKAAVRGFAEFCAHEGWTPCLYSISAELRDSVRAHGWQTVQVAEDTVIPLPALAFTGKKWQDVRTALNKASKEGITAEWWRWADLPLALSDQIRSISDEWVADKGLPEMGFTLGGLPELAGDGVRLLLAVDADRTVHGITSWLPVHVDGAVVGWTLDFMRRRACGFRGSMEFLIASAALTLRKEGAEFLSLSGAPLARLDRGEQPRALQRVLDLTGQVLEPVYGFRSLFAFKAKFQPVYRPMYMAYPDSAALPRIANAIGRAYLPHMSARQGFRLASKVILAKRVIRNSPTPLHTKA